MSLKPMEEWEKPFFETRMHACPLRTHSTSFQLVDEQGDGKPYAGLAYEVTDYEDAVYLGVLDEKGAGKVNRHYCGPVILKLNQPYQGQDALYVRLKERKAYPLPITELQVRAEKTRFLNPSGARTQLNPAQDQADAFYQVEVSELVEHRAHLPPLAPRNFPPAHHVHIADVPARAGRFQTTPNSGYGPVAEQAPCAGGAAAAGIAPDALYR